MAKLLGEYEYAGAMENFRHKFESVKNEVDNPTYIYNSNLRPYQNIDVQALSMLKQKGVFNAMRCGKTPTTIASIVNEGYKKVLVLVPSFLKYQWKDEFVKWSNFTEDEVRIINGTQLERLGQYYEVKTRDKYVVIVSYDTVKTDLKKFAKLGDGFEAMVVDEAHFLRNLKSSRSNCVFDIAKGYLLDMLLQEHQQYSTLKIFTVY